jgi:hypothetical protein
LKIRLLLFILLCMLVSTTAWAATFDIPRYLSPDQTISDDVYMVGETVIVKGKVIGDLMALGKTISCSGAIAADLLAIGLHIEAAGNINDDIRALGLQTHLRGLVGDDAALAGFKVIIEPDSRIGHTAVVAAGQSVVNGSVLGDLIITSYDCTLGGDVKGNVTASVAKLQLSPTTRIKGNLIYTSQNPVIIPPGAVIEGQVIHRKPPAAPNYITSTDSEPRWSNLIGMVVWDVSLVFAGVFLLFLVPQTIQVSSQTMAAKPWLTCMYGFLWLVGAPVTASLGIITVIGLPIAIAVVFLYLSSLYLSALPVALWVGQKIFRTADKPYLSLILGLLVISVLRSLPYVGFVFGLIFLTVGLGSLALSFRNYVWNNRG